jgi:radical SAM-linked protein
MVADKFRFRFRKVGDLRLLSHLDLTRCFERMLRRAEIPFKSSEGFHPSPRMIFALSMPLGCDGANEVLELELTQPLDSEEVRNRLNSQAPKGLEFNSAVGVPMNKSAMARRAEYLLPIPEDRLEALRTRAAEIMAQEKVWVERFKPKPRRLNIRPYLRNISIIDFRSPASTSEVESGLRKSALLLDLWVTSWGTARADELLKLLGVDDLLDAGHILVRRSLEIHDETETLDGSDRPPEGVPESTPLDHDPARAGDHDEPASATWGLSPNGPVVE